MTTVELTVERVGARGDGIARHEGRPVYLALTAPGDRVRAELGPRHGEGREGRVLELLAPGDRQPAACPHFGDCGGCALQHLGDEAYVRAKEGLLRDALAHHGLADAPMAPLVRLPPGTRRRARFAIERRRGAARIGFNARASHRITDLRVCPVLHPSLAALLAPLRTLAEALWPDGTAGAATATVSETGIDLLLDLPRAPDLAALEALARFAAGSCLARLQWRAPGSGEATPVAQHSPRVSFAGIAVTPPADAFLQASAEADQVLTRLVRAAVGDADRVADLYAGVGTFTFPLAQTASVHAVEGSAAAAAALRSAAALAACHRVAVEHRDLDARPLLPAELDHFDAVVLDPPRVGAAPQCMALAASRVRRVAMVSCNPATFGRDARTLVDGGYVATDIHPVDAFVWSPHLELVACFERV